ncbi:MAG: hypothetical protein AAGF73_06085 [Actinomycetota bacterium]
MDAADTSRLILFTACVAATAFGFVEAYHNRSYRRQFGVCAFWTACMSWGVASLTFDSLPTMGWSVEMLNFSATGVVLSWPFIQSRRVGAERAVVEGFDG